MKLKELLNVLNPREFCCVSWNSGESMEDVYNYANLLKHDTKILTFNVVVVYTSKGNENQSIIHILLDPSTHAEEKEL